MAAWDAGATFKRLRLGLLSLAVFRGVLEDDVIAAVARCVELGNRLEADPARPGLEHEYADAFAQLVAALLATGDADLATHVRTVVLDDENAYLRRLGAGGRVVQELEDAAATELETLGRMANLTADDLLALAADSAGLSGGGRSALDLFLARFPEDGVPVEALSALVASRGASYDVREQALFKLLEPATRPAGEAALRAFSDSLAPEDGDLLPFAAGKLAELAGVSNPDGDDEKVWDSEAPVVFFLANAEGGLQARDLANYLEYALRRDDPEFPPVVELGTWEFANDFLLESKDRIGDFPPSERAALDRIAASLDRLVEYDPAFNPFETVEDDGDEDAGE